MKSVRPASALCALSALAASSAFAQSADTPPPAAGGQLDTVTVTSHTLGRGEARVNSVIDAETIREQPAGLDPLKQLNRVPGLQVSSSDALTGSFSMRLSMRGFNKEQIGISIDGIPNGSSLSNGGSMPQRLLESANVDRISVSQTAGEIGTPSNQALGGFIDFRTSDPSSQKRVTSELSAGNFNYRRAFVRVDTGELGGGLKAYVDYSNEQVNTWPGQQSGRSRRDHFDARVLKTFADGSTLRGTLSYNNMADNDYDAVALTALSAPFYKTNFQTNPKTDALTDAWTGNPAIDQNNRGTRGIGAREFFGHVDLLAKLNESSSISFKPYFHHQEGEGWFYVPYKQLPSNGQLYSTVASGVKTATPVVQECFANQYQRNADGSLIPLGAVAFPTGVTAATLAQAGCPAAAKYAMNAQSAWGAREATTRKGGYKLDRQGFLSEVKASVGFQELRAGLWYEHIDRKKTRNWYSATDPSQSWSFQDSGLYSITQDRHYQSNGLMGYAQDRLNLLDDKVEVDIGATYQRFAESYASPVEFFGTRALTVKSKLLPKVAALYRITNDVEVFTSASKNFSAIPDTVFEGTSAVDSRNGVKPETSLNKDVGIRWQTGNAGLSVALYDIAYRNRISIQNGNPNGDIFSRDATTTFENQGGIHSRGLEVTARYAISTLEFYANYAYNKARYTADTPAEGILANDPVLGMARHNIFAETVWRATPDWRLAGNVKYTSKAPGTYDVVYNSSSGIAPGNALIAGGPAFFPREYEPAYAVVGMSASYKLPAGFISLKASEVAFNVDNLFNRRYLGGIGAELTTSNPLTSGRYFLGSPRAFYVTLRASI